jgi:L-ascorbate metabolism protein UlaG (beta-lactamase superfamily)
MLKRTFVTAILATSLTLPAPAADKPLTIRWLGQSFFVLTTSAGTRVAVDPHAIEAFGKPTTSADLVLISHFHPDHVRLEAIENRDQAKVVYGLTPPAGGGNPARAAWNPVRETFKDVRVRNVGTYHDTSQGMQRGRNSVFIVEADGLKVVHLGDLGHVLGDEQVRQIGQPDVLMVPAGGVYTINGSKAKEVVAQLKPKRYVLPMHYGTRTFEDLLPLDEFLDGQTNVKRTPATNELQVSAAEPVPAAPTTVILGWTKGGK